MLNLAKLDELTNLVKSKPDHSERTTSMLGERQTIAKQISDFISECSKQEQDIRTLPPFPKNQYAFLLYELSCTKREEGDNKSAIEYVDKALAIIENIEEKDQLVYAALLLSKAISERELALSSEDSTKKADYLTAASKTIDIMRTTLSRMSQTESPLLDPEKTKLILGIYPLHEAGITYLRQEPRSEEALTNAISCFTDALKKSSTVPQMSLIRVESYLGLAHTLFLEKFGDDREDTHSKAAQTALNEGKRIARETGQLETTNQDVATLLFHSSKYLNYIHDPVAAFCDAVHALYIRTQVFFRTQSKITELYDQLTQAFDRIDDKRQLVAVRLLLEKIHLFQTSPPPEAIKALEPTKAVLEYHKETCAPRTSGYLDQIPLPSPSPF